MQARLVTLQVKSGQIDEVIAIFTERVVPAARAQRGFGGGRVLANRETGKVLLMTLWQSVADLQANEASGFFREQVAAFQPHIEGAPVREQYELAAHANP